LSRKSTDSPEPEEVVEEIAEEVAEDTNCCSGFVFCYYAGASGAVY